MIPSLVWLEAAEKTSTISSLPPHPESRPCADTHGGSWRFDSTSTPPCTSRMKFLCNAIAAPISFRTLSLGFLRGFSSWPTILLKRDVDD